MPSHGRKPPNPQNVPKSWGHKPPPPPRRSGKPLWCPMVGAVRALSRGRLRLARRYAAMSLRLMGQAALGAWVAGAVLISTGVLHV